LARGQRGKKRSGHIYGGICFKDRSPQLITFGLKSALSHIAVFHPGVAMMTPSVSTTSLRIRCSALSPSIGQSEKIKWRAGETCSNFGMLNNFNLQGLIVICWWQTLSQ
jgi:hypothetical protein